MKTLREIEIPKVSVVIPTYNGGQFLVEALKSVFNQTFKDFEVLVVDDGSTEDIGKLCAEFSTIRLIRQNNSGVSVARNNGILNARADLIALLDHDDVWCKSKLAKQYKLFELDPEIAMCFTDHSIIDSEGKRLIEPGDCSQTKQKTTLDGLVDEICDVQEFAVNEVKPIDVVMGEFYPSSVMLRKSACAECGLFDPFYRNTDDTDAWMKISLRLKVVRLRSAEILYRRHSNSQSYNLKFNESEISRLSARYIQYGRSVKRDDIMEMGAALLRNAHFHMGVRAFDQARIALRHKNYSAFVDCFWMAFRWNPHFVLRNLCTWFGSKLKAMILSR